jgi:hypothetical protein
MPSCRPDVIPEILYKLMEMKPKLILEVGIGHGKWGVLCHEYLKYWCSIIPRIDGVEAFSDYVSPAHEVYNGVIYGDVMEVIDKLDVGAYDLVMIIDVIEHLEKEDGLKLLSMAKRYLVTTPEYWNPQGACFGNEFEKHISKWEPSDFENSILIPDKVGRKHIMGWK